MSKISRSGGRSQDLFQGSIMASTSVTEMNISFPIQLS